MKNAVQSHGGSILQSSAWAGFQTALGREVHQGSGLGWSWLATLRKSRGIRYLLCSYGPVAVSEATMKTAITDLMSKAVQLDVDFVRIEPQVNASPKLLQSIGAKRISELDPTHTRIVDLTKSEAELRGDMTSGHRNNVNGTERRGIRIRSSHDAADLELLIDMLHDTARRSHVTFHPDAYFRTLFATLAEETVLYIAEVAGKPVAASMFHDAGDTRYYAHAGAYQELNRKVRASISIVWQAMLDAKAKGLQRFDMWGVAPEGDDTHHLATLSRFKAGFGGEQVEYCGTWDIPVRHAKYRLYQVYRRLRGLT